MTAEGAVLISGSQWLQGKGEDVYSNGGNFGTYYQCVELPQQRLYPNKGWPRVYAAGNGGAQYIPEGSPGLTRYNPGSKYIPVPGDLVIEYGNSWNPYGHVSVVDYTDVEKGTIYAVEQNASANGRVTYAYNGSNYIGLSASRSVKCILHAPGNNFKNPSSISKKQINKYITITKDGQSFFGNTECTSKKGTTARGRIYYVKIAYILGNGKLLYSVYKDEKSSDWLGYLKEGASEFTSIQTFDKKKVTLTSSSATLWKDLNYTGKMGTSVSGENYVVNRIFQNTTNNAFYHELYRGSTFCGYINSGSVKDLSNKKVNKYITITKDGQSFFGNLECTSKKGTTATGRIYYVKIAYNLGNGKLLYSVYKDETASDWLGYLKEGASEFTPIQTFDKKKVTLTSSSATLWKDLNYTGKMGTSVSGENYVVNRIFQNTTNNAFYHELYRGSTFCGYINSGSVKDLTNKKVNKYITITKDGQSFFGNLECTSKKGTTATGRIYYVKIAYILGNGKLLYSVYKDETASDWLGYLKEGASEFTPIQTFEQKRVTLTSNSATLWKDLNYTGKMGTSVSGENYVVNRIFQNTTNNAFYHELYRGSTFCGYINSGSVKDLTNKKVNKYITITKDGQSFFGNLECTSKKGTTATGRIYYVKIAYNLGNGKLLYSVYKDETTLDWLGYLKEGASEFTRIQELDGQNVIVSKNGYTLWKDLNYTGKMGSSVLGDKYVVNRLFYNSTNNASYHELYRENEFQGYINSDAIQTATE